MVDSKVSDICARCRNELSEDEKEIGIPICQDCVDLLINNVKDKVKRSEERKIEKEVENFSRFILSSGNLFKLDDMTIIQCSFNIFMSETVNLEDKNLVISEKILRDSIRFIQRELEKIEEKRNKSSNPNVRMMSMFDALIREGMKKGNGDKEEKEDMKEDKEEKEDMKEDKEEKIEKKESLPGKREKAD